MLLQCVSSALSKALVELHSHSQPAFFRLYVASSLSDPTPFYPFHTH